MIIYEVDRERERKGGKTEKMRIIAVDITYR